MALYYNVCTYVSCEWHHVTVLVLLSLVSGIMLLCMYSCLINYNVYVLPSPVNDVVLLYISASNSAV